MPDSKIDSLCNFFKPSAFKICVAGLFFILNVFIVVGSIAGSYDSPFAPEAIIDYVLLIIAMPGLILPIMLGSKSMITYYISNLIYSYIVACFLVWLNDRIKGDSRKRQAMIIVILVILLCCSIVLTSSPHPSPETNQNDEIARMGTIVYCKSWHDEWCITHPNQTPAVEEMPVRSFEMNGKKYTIKCMDIFENLGYDLKCNK